MLRLKSAAKLNLFFRVLKKRSDGYHEIASLYQAIDLFDTLTFSRSDSDQFSCSFPELETENNLVLRALKLFRDRFSLPGIKIHLEKKIPLQAGLGGGSSNAATTLWALNELSNRPASLKDLTLMGALLGSDVPFFFSSGTAYCTGRGEILEPFILPSPIHGWIAKPPFGLSTPLVYQETKVEELVPDSSLFYNDLTPAAFRLEPRLQEFEKSLLNRGFETVSMTGSGTAFFCFGINADTQGLIPFTSIQREESFWY